MAAAAANISAPWFCSSIAFTKVGRWILLALIFQIIVYFLYTLFGLGIFLAGKQELRGTRECQGCFPIKKWLLNNGHTTKYQNRTEERIGATFLMRQRNLLLFSIREVNLKLSNTSCSKWWANPLSISEIEEQCLSPDLKQYTLTFEAQPGRVPFKSIVQVFKNYPNETHRYVSDDFVFISATRLDDFQKCQFQVDEAVRNICLCTVDKAKVLLTQEIRKKWNAADAEHPNWPPNATAMVADFLNVAAYNNYLRTPNATLNFCGIDVKLLIFVSSAPAHLERRNAIRNSFGKFEYLDKHGVRLIFSFGKVLDPLTQRSLVNESALYGDILQSNFYDHYQNQSLSELFFYNWVATHCAEKRAPMPLWVLKADDDSFLNVPLLLRVAEANPNVEIIGCLLCPQKVWRQGKYVVPKYMYAPEYWFGFAFGGAALLRSEILGPLLKASLTSPIVNMNDVYITGILAKEISVQPLNSPLFQTNTIIRGEQGCSKARIMVNTYANSSDEMMLHWKALTGPIVKGCALKEKLLKAEPLTLQTKLDCFFD